MNVSSTSSNFWHLSVLSSKKANKTGDTFKKRRNKNILTYPLFIAKIASNSFSLQFQKRSDSQAVICNKKYTNCEWGKLKLTPTGWKGKSFYLLTNFLLFVFSLFLDVYWGDFLWWGLIFWQMRLRGCLLCFCQLRWAV